MNKPISEVEIVIKKFQEKREELKSWLYGTIYKRYDTEETAEVVQEDVDNYFSDEWINEFISEAITATREEMVEVFRETVKAQGLNWSDFRNKMLEIDTSYSPKQKDSEV